MTKDVLRKHTDGLIKIKTNAYWHDDNRKNELVDRFVLLLEVNKFPAYQYQNPRHACDGRLKNQNGVIASIDVILTVFIDNEKLKLGVNYDLIEIVK